MSHQQANPRRLVVFVPGLQPSSQRALQEWENLRKRLNSEPDYAGSTVHWLLFAHGTTVFSRGGLHEQAHTLQAKIDEQWSLACGYDDIVLVAHSIGGPILRAAYLLGAAESSNGRSHWTQRVSRFVLFASINRGIATRRIWWLRPVAWLARHSRVVSSFRIVDGYRGSNFLTNLRIDWIRHFGVLAEEESNATQRPAGCSKRTPRVVQVLGTKDGLVRPEDSKDVLAFRNAVHLQVAGANHANVYYLGDDTDTKARYAVLRKAFFEQPSGHAAPPPPSQPAGAQVKHVIFLLHGIRASNVGNWITQLANSIRACNRTNTIVVQPTYGYLSAARFVLPSVRKKNIATFQDWYTEVLADHPTATYSIVAHSNGSYMLGYSLRAIPGMQFAKVVLVGSVLPENFWVRSGAPTKQVACIQNHRAKRDWPVALLCSALAGGLRMRDIGTSGFDGFHGTLTKEVGYYNGGHSKALHPNYHGSLVNFLYDGCKGKGPGSLGPAPVVFQRLSNAAPYAAIVAVAGLVWGLGWFVVAFDGIAGLGDRLLLVVMALIGAYVVMDVI